MNEELQNELEEVKKKADEYLNGWKRATADYQNLQKETVRERERLAQYATEEIIRDFLPVLDQAGEAFRNAPTDADQKIQEWIRGVKIVFDGFAHLLRSYGVEKIEVLGKPFDPMYHETVGSRRQEGSVAGIVLEDARPGYTLHGRILRPAQVIISE